MLGSEDHFEYHDNEWDDFEETNVRGENAQRKNSRLF
jgi:hypothetical protein